MSSEQVAQVLRQCGNRVKLMIARGAVEETTAPSSLGITLSSSPISASEMRVSIWKQWLYGLNKWHAEIRLTDAVFKY